MFVPQRRRRPILWTSHAAASANLESNGASDQAQIRPLDLIQEDGNEDSDPIITESKLNDTSSQGNCQSGRNPSNADDTPGAPPSNLRSWSPTMFTVGLPASPTPEAVDLGRKYQHAAAASRTGLGPFQLKSRYPCRFCRQGLYSSSSNRLRHERARHPVELERLQAREGRSAGRHKAGVSRRNASEAFEKITNGATVQLSSSCTKARGPQLEATAAAVDVVELIQPPNHLDQADHNHENRMKVDDEQAPDPSVSVNISPMIGPSGNVDSVSELGVETSGANQLHDPSSSSASHEESKSDLELGHDSGCVAVEPITASSPRAGGQSQIQEDSSSEYELESGSCSSSESDNSGSDTDMEGAHSAVVIPGARPLLQESQLDQAIKPLFDWLAQPPVTQCEALAKPKRVKSPSQTQPIRSNIRFIFALLYEHKSVETVDLAAFKRLDICQTLHQAVKERGVGAGRIFAIFLLVKKCLVYLSSLESTRLRQFVQPTTFDSYMYVDSVCSDSSMQRRQQARNRMVLGAETVAVLQNTSSRNVHHVDPSPRSQDIQHGHHTSAAASVSSGCSATMSKDELQRVTVGCMAALDRIIKSGVPESMDQSFVHLLVTATLCLGLAPRSQILRQLQVGSTFVKQPDGLYWVRILAEMSKNGKPTMFSLAEELTPPYDTYLSTVRPRLLGKCADRAAASHQFVFFKRNGAAPRPDFGSSTTVVTQMLIGKAINPHSFRSSIITTFYEAGGGATQTEMDMLANIMAHDPATARQFYYKPAHAQATVQTSRRMVEELLSTFCL